VIVRLVSRSKNYNFILLGSGIFSAVFLESYCRKLSLLQVQISVHHPMRPDSF